MRITTIAASLALTVTSTAFAQSVDTELDQFEANLFSDGIEYPEIPIDNSDILRPNKWSYITETFDKHFHKCFKDVRRSIGSVVWHNGSGGYKDYASGNIWISRKDPTEGKFIGTFSLKPCEENFAKSCPYPEFISQAYKLSYGWEGRSTSKRKFKGMTIDTLWSNIPVGGSVTAEIKANSRTGYAAHFHVVVTRSGDSRASGFVLERLANGLGDNVRHCAKESFAKLGVPGAEVIIRR
jgi:hypothetical protein